MRESKRFCRPILTLNAGGAHLNQIASASSPGRIYISRKKNDGTAIGNNHFIEAVILYSKRFRHLGKFCSQCLFCLVPSHCQFRLSGSHPMHGICHTVQRVLCIPPNQICIKKKERTVLPASPGCIIIPPLSILYLSQKFVSGNLASASSAVDFCFFVKL